MKKKNEFVRINVISIIGAIALFMGVASDPASAVLIVIGLGLLGVSALLIYTTKV